MSDPRVVPTQSEPERAHCSTHEQYTPTCVACVRASVKAAQEWLPEDRTGMYRGTLPEWD